MKSKSQSGFTIVELLVISPIVLVITVAAISYLFNIYGHLVKQGAQLNLHLEAQNILFGLQDELWYANQFTGSLNSNLVDTYQPGGGWSSATTPPTLIVSTASLTTNRRDTNRQPIYINESTCTPPDGNGINSVLYNNVVYFVAGTHLYKRTISAPPSLPTCGTPYEKQTCPAASTSPDCLADVLLSDHINSFSVTYYDSSNAVVTSPESAYSVKVNLTLKDKAFAEDIFASSSLRLRRLND